MEKVKRQPRGTVSREQIAQVALLIADEEGIDALSMRDLAKRLGVGTMTIYGHIEGKDDLFDAIVDSAVADREPFVSEGDWQEQVRGSVLAVRRGLLLHPCLVEIRARRPVLRPEALRFSEHLLSVLRTAGFEPTEAAQAFRLLFTYTFGYAAFSPVETTEANRAEAREALADLPRDEYPALAESVEQASEAMGGEAAFEYGLDRILDGLAARLSD
jgi:TetR/AcrR family tetracycline transcriptional repressor